MKFSVIIPVYNKADTIVESIDSVLNQSFNNFEIIVINDGSTDNILTVLNKYKNKIKIINQKNSGVSVSRNNGIKNAKGEYICFLDADDIWYKNHLQELDRLIEKYKDNDFFITSHVTTDYQGNRLYSNKKLNNYNKDFVTNNLLGFANKNGDSIFHTNSICIKKNQLMKNRLFFEPHEKIGEDTDLWYRISFYCQVVISKKTTTMYRKENSTATKKTSNSFEWIFARRYYDILNNDKISVEIKESYRKLISRYHLACARDYIMINDRKNALKRISMVDNKKTLNYVLTSIMCHQPFLIAHLIYNIKYNRR